MDYVTFNRILAVANEGEYELESFMHRESGLIVFTFKRNPSYRSEKEIQGL